MSPQEKVTKAFPPNAEVRISEEHLREFLQSDQAALKSFEEQYAVLLEIRALTCARNQSIDHFASVATVKALPLSRDCLAAQDAQLSQYLGMRQVAIRFSQPPLRPLVPLGTPAAIPGTAGLEIYAGETASNAGVAVLQSTRGEFVSIEIPSGKKIANLPTMADASYRALLSPNGRVIAIDTRNSGVTFVDTETGTKLWEAKNIKELLAWMPEISAALATDSKSGALSLINFKTVTVESHFSGLSNQTWALPVTHSPSRLLIGSQYEFALVEHTRGPEGIKGTIVKEFRIKEGQGITSSPPTLMLGGKAIVFIAARDFAAINLESGAEILWPTGVLLANRYAKLGETKLLIDSLEANGVAAKPWVLDIEKISLSPVETEAGSSGILVELAGRTGFMRRGYDQVWFGDKVKTGEPVQLDARLNALNAERNVERQVERLEAQMRGSNFVASRVVDAPSAQTAAIDNANSPIVALARDAQIEAVGVYQGSPGTLVATDGRKVGQVEIRVRRSAKPVILALSSYEPVQWTLIPEPDAKISAVLVSGYYSSRVIGAGTASVVMTGKAYAYKTGNPEYNVLNQEIAKWTGKSIDTFQGEYEGNSFSVGGS